MQEGERLRQQHTHTHCRGVAATPPVISMVLYSVPVAADHTITRPSLAQVANRSSRRRLLRGVDELGRGSGSEACAYHVSEVMDRAWPVKTRSSVNVLML